MTDIREIEVVLQRCTRGQREEVFRLLRREFAIHPLEDELHAKAEVILEAIQLALEITLRMLRGVIAEAAFRVEVVDHLEGWQVVPTVAAGSSYDFVLNDGNGDVRVQVKLQRRKAGRPMLATEGLRALPSDMYVPETWKTRKGDKKGSATRPYRFGEFDVLAVAMYPSTNQWASFMYTVVSWLLPDPSDRTQLFKYQPVAMAPNSDWTNDFATAAGWFRSGQSKTIHPAAIVRAAKNRRNKKRPSGK